MLFPVCLIDFDLLRDLKADSSSEPESPRLCALTHETLVSQCRVATRRRSYAYALLSSRCLHLPPIQRESGCGVSAARTRRPYLDAASRLRDERQRDRVPGPAGASVQEPTASPHEIALDRTEQKDGKFHRKRLGQLRIRRIASTLPVSQCPQNQRDVF